MTGATGKHIDEAMVRHIAMLGRLNLGEEEIKLFGDQLSDILSYVDKLSALDTSGVQPLAHPLPIHNVFREDVAHEPFTSERALSNAPDKDGSFFKVPQVLDQDTV